MIPKHLRPGISIPRTPNYTLYRNDRQTQNIPSGGTAILIKSSLKYHHIPTPALRDDRSTITPPAANFIPTTTLRVHSRLGGNFRTRAFLHFMRNYNAHHTLGLLTSTPGGNRLKI
ncbi:hypothetical protein TNCV_566881 [Trichonephila clavipes]|nr:hypothetical protein TNCV_566881 [Trichonephila clavipes]